MKNFFTVVFIFTLIAILLVGCGGKIDARSGCRVLREYNNNVTYQTVCDHCGYEFGDPTTTYVADELYYSVTCTQCRETIYVHLKR